MRGTEYFTLAFGTIIGVGWMVVVTQWLSRGGPGGAMLAFLIGGLAMVPVVLVYGRLAAKMPESASEIAYTAAVFPPAVSFTTGWIMTFAYLIVCPFEAVAIGQIASYVFGDLNAVPLYRIGEAETGTVYLPHLVLGIGLTGLITYINYRGIRLSTRFQNWTTFGLLGVFAIFVPLGVWRGTTVNLEPLFFHKTAAAGLWPATLAVLAIVPYYMTGWETIPKCAEEASTDFDPGRFVRVMLLAVAVGTFFYVAVVGVVALLQPWEELRSVERFATAYAFEKAFGWPWLVRLMLFGAFLSLLKVFNGCFLAATRLLYAMGRRNLLGGQLGAVDELRQTPTVAILLVGGFTALASFLGYAILDPIGEIGSLAAALAWMATCLAYCCGAAGEITWKGRLLGSCGVLVSLAFAAIVARSMAQNEMAWSLWTTAAAWTLLGIVLWKVQSTRSV
jgi:amino acid transporter